LERAAMMALVRIALKRPYTFVVMSLLIAVLGIGSIFTMPTDIFPPINIPVVSVIWSYNGISPDETTCIGDAMQVVNGYQSASLLELSSGFRRSSL
jgi:multidrug efflux pump subunit AcrB